MTDLDPTVGAVTETAAIAALAHQAATPTIDLMDDDDRILSVALPDGWRHTLVDLGDLHQDTPTRARGTVNVHDAASFIAAVRQRADDEDRVAVYGDEDQRQLVAVLNDDNTTGGHWRDHRVNLQLRRTPEWQHWASHDGQLLEQEVFADHIEDGLAELGDQAANMLELAQTIQGMTSTRWKGGARLADGSRQFQYEEEAEATAGANGQLTIPDIFTVTVRPFYGSDRVQVVARFRYRLPRGGGAVKLGYKLDRPHEVERLAFTSIVEQVTGDLAAVAFIRGVAPTAVPEPAARVIPTR